MNHIDEKTLQDLAEHRKAIQRKVYRDDDGVVLDIGYEYRVTLDRVSAPAEILAWVLHFQTKGSVDKDMLMEFIRVATSATGILLPNP